MNPVVENKKPENKLFSGFDLEQGTGVEPASKAWEAFILPMYYPCKS